MTDPQETGENTQSLAHSDTESSTHREAETGGSDVGGPAGTLEGATEDALTDDSGNPDNVADGQSRNPL